MIGRRHQRTGWRGSILFVLALVAALGPSWAANYICPMARAESHLPACCSHRLFANASSPESFQVACHCPIPTWQAGAVEANRSLVPSAPHAQIVADLPRSMVSIAAPAATVAFEQVRPPPRSGPALWVRNQSILR
ncbi:MAG TPA: hypothetical protein VN931_04885 [Fibrobacteria bacterium]|nr:hypothetical protein [Fibrobacteria bacterium]